MSLVQIGSLTMCESNIGAVLLRGQSVWICPVGQGLMDCLRGQSVNLPSWSRFNGLLLRVCQKRSTSGKQKPHSWPLKYWIISMIWMYSASVIFFFQVKNFKVNQKMRIPLNFSLFGTPVFTFNFKNELFFFGSHVIFKNSLACFDLFWNRFHFHCFILLPLIFFTSVFLLCHT